MQQRLAVFNSDQVNAYGIKMPLPTLADALEQGWLLGQPMFLNHDRHRLEGWTRALGIHLEPGLARLTGLCATPESEVEGEQLKNLVYDFFARRAAALVEPHRADLETRLKPFLQGKAQPIYLESAALIEPGLAERAFVDIFEKRDKDGLVPLSELPAVAPGVFERDGLLFFASSFFRRSLSRHNTLNAPLLTRLHGLAPTAGLSVKIRLDPDAVGLACTYQTPLEFAYWWGPKFKDDLLSIPNGITRHEADDRLRLFSGVSRTEFWWHEQNDLKTLECEEIMDIPSLGVSRSDFGCRYVHSIVDPKGKRPFHLDGAIRLYDEEKMLERLESDMYHAGRHTRYEKLWRIDGNISIPTWKEIITHYYRDNELIGEYLGGIDDSGHLRPQIVDPEGDPLYRYVPTTMSPGNGVRISVAYQLPTEDGPAVELVAHDTFGSSSERSSYVEGDTFEIVKVLRRNGVSVSVPDGLMRLAFEDTSANLAMIMHRGPKAAETAEETLKAVKTLCDAWVARGDDRIVSFNIGVAYPDRTVHVSFAGHVVDFKQLFDSVGTSIPKAVSDVSPWLEHVYSRLNALFTPSQDRPSLSSMLQQTGILQFDRKMIEPALFTLGQDDENRPTVLFGIPKDRVDLIKLMTEGRITWADLWLMRHTICSVCKNDYLACNCSKYLDGPVHQEMRDVDLCGLFWTNRPASTRVHVLPESSETQRPTAT